MARPVQHANVKTEPNREEVAYVNREGKEVGPSDKEPVTILRGDDVAEWDKEQKAAKAEAKATKAKGSPEDKSAEAPEDK